MTMAEQLQWNIKKMAKAAELKEEAKKKEAENPTPPKPTGPVGPKTKEELSKMTMQEQLQYMR
jgi:hypothetical protein